MSKKTPRSVEAMLWEEAREAMEAERKGRPYEPGEMQKAYPQAYDAMREFMGATATDLPKVLASIRQADTLSEMLHSENEGLHSIQGYLVAHPPDALTVARLIALEREREAGPLEKKAQSILGRRAAEVRHNKPGGSREKQARIREIWASGKYTSRDRCAEEEGRALGMSFSAARRALRNTPDPS